MPFAAGDAWGQILEWLQGVIIPDWNGLIALLPIFVILGLTGPLLSLLALYWLYHAFIDRGGSVHIDEVGPSVAKGRSKGDAPEIDGAVYVKSRRPLKVGEFANVKIERADEYDLHGTAVGS